jgi:hypothetical protein
MDEAEMRSFRHDLRGRWHGLRLCIEALRTCTTQEEILEFLDSTCCAADEVCQTLSQLTEGYENS